MPFFSLTRRPLRQNDLVGLTPRRVRSLSSGGWGLVVSIALAGPFGEVALETGPGRPARGLADVVTASEGNLAAMDVRSIAWSDLPSIARAALHAKGIREDGFPAYVDRTRASNRRRVQEGDLDHLVFYALQGTAFTQLAPIEPALSAKALVDGLEDARRTAFLADPSSADPESVPPEVRVRARAFLQALEQPSRDERLTYFREIAKSAPADARRREAWLLREYLRAMRFVYEKEFTARAAPRETIAELYRTRGLSTDTSVEAGYLIYLGLGIVRALEPARSVRRVLIVGPGLDLAPRTGLRETAAPESYQPWAVMDALVGLGLAKADELEVVTADINPRVVAHLNRARQQPPAITLVDEVGDDEHVTLTKDFREYVARLGQSIGRVEPVNLAGRRTDRPVTLLHVGNSAARALHATALDIVTSRLHAPPFDLVVVTNVLPYFSDVDLALALTNIAAMLADGGVLLHNEGRPLVGQLTSELGLPMAQSRHAVIAHVRGAAPLGDSVWVHIRRR